MSWQKKGTRFTFLLLYSSGNGSVKSFTKTLSETFITTKKMKKLSRLVFFIQSVFIIASCSSKYNLFKQDAEYLPKPHHYQPYVIGCGDTLSVLVWGHDNLSADVIVRPDGKVSLALIGDINAEGLSVQDLQNEINRELGEYIRDPCVSVSVSRVNSMKIYILGEVNHPGEYDLISRVDVLQAIAKAGGFTIYAEKSRVRVIRIEDGENMKIKFDYNQVIKGKNLDQNIPLKPGDVVIVP